MGSSMGECRAAIRAFSRETAEASIAQTVAERSPQKIMLASELSRCQKV